MCFYVVDPPVVSSIDDVQRVEHTRVNVRCIVTPGNPNTTSIYWTKSGYSGVRGTGTTFVLNNISRTDSGTYFCIAENTYKSGGKGEDQQSFIIDVLCRRTLILLVFLKIFTSFVCSDDIELVFFFKMDPHLVLVKR